MAWCGNESYAIARQDLLIDGVAALGAPWFIGGRGVSGAANESIWLAVVTRGHSNCTYTRNCSDFYLYQFVNVIRFIVQFRLQLRAVVCSDEVLAILETE